MGKMHVDFNQFMDKFLTIRTRRYRLLKKRRSVFQIEGREGVKWELGFFFFRGWEMGFCSLGLGFMKQKQ